MPVRLNNNHFIWSLSLALLFTLVLGIDKGLAQSTPTTEWRPLYQTATPIPPLATNCPDGTPVGYGQVTPNAAWNIRCSHCLPTPRPRWTPYTFPGACSAMPDPEECTGRLIEGKNFCVCGEVQPTVTPTVAPTTGPMYWISTQYTVDWWNTTGGGWSTTYGYIYPVKPANQQFAGVIYRGKYEGQYNNLFFGWAEGDPEGITNIGSGFAQPGAGQWGPWMCVGKTTAVCPAVNWQSSGTAQFYETGTRFRFDLQKYAAYDSHGFVELYVIYYGVPYYLDPTPTPFPGVCGMINQEPADGRDREATLPTFMVGDGSSFTLGGFTWDITWISQLAELAGINIPTSLEFPRFTFNFLPIKFGTLEILGVDIDLDILAFILSAIAGWRIFARS